MATTKRTTPNAAKVFSLSPNLLISDREELATFINISLKRLTYILYSKKRTSHYKEFQISKPSGAPRTLHAVSGELKLLQRKALDALQAQYKPSRYSHGFTPSKSIISNAEYHRRKKLVLKVDLEDFFPSINFGRVQGLFSSPPFNFGKEAAMTMAQMSCLDDVQGTLPQGGVLSPYIANMLCRRLDKKLAKLATENRCRFTRYADDITFSTNDVVKLPVKNLLKSIYSIIKSEHFVVNKKKTKLLTQRDRQVITGIIVNDGLNVNRKYVRNLRATIHNCEKSGVRSQLNKANFRDNRNSRPSPWDGTVPTEEFFLKHLLGKITFWGNVIVSNHQDKQHDDDKTTYKRIRTYEKLLWRFYNLPEVQANSNIVKSVKVALRRRAPLAKLLSFKGQGTTRRKEILTIFQNDAEVQKTLCDVGNAKSISELNDIIVRKKKTDPRFFERSFGTELELVKTNLKKYLEYPPINREHTKRVLESLKQEGGLKNLVHSNEEGWSIKDCYHVLLENYESLFYYLHFDLREEFENWKESLDYIATQHDDDFHIDVIANPDISDATTQLKKNTRFGRHPAESTQLKSEIQYIIDKIVSEELPIRINPKLINSFYTHVPSVLRTIEIILESMSRHSAISDANEIMIASELKDDVVEIIIFDNSTDPVFDNLDNRDVFHGKLSTVVKKTNGLCEYYIEVSVRCGNRVSMNMHTEELVSPIKEHGFVHRLIFPYIG